jgi:DNA-3-methyladenine glycosylase II
MRPLSNGNLFDGIVTAIVGQSISVQAAAVTERKLAELFNQPLAYGTRNYWPPPRIEQLANAEPSFIRLSGVTQRRADAIVAIARLAMTNRLLPPDVNLADEPAVYDAVLALPLVGKWTAESVLLWGLGADDAYPVGDVALLRAARLAYGRPEMTHAEMDLLAERWRPGRSWASRWLWLNLFGAAPLSGSG